jgi:hypothetical protein
MYLVNIAAALTHAPGVLDLYFWLAWKSWTVNGTPGYLPLFGANGLKHQLGCKEYSTGKRFRQTLQKWIGRIKVLWPQCPAAIAPDGRFLAVRSSGPNALPRLRRRDVFSRLTRLEALLLSTGFPRTTKPIVRRDALLTITSHYLT